MTSTKWPLGEAPQLYAEVARRQITLVSGASMLAHEITEQTLKQALGLVNTSVDHGQQFNAAHAMANAAQSAVSGYQRGVTQQNLTNGSGTIVTTHTRGNQTVTVTLFCNHGNIVRIVRH